MTAHMVITKCIHRKIDIRKVVIKFLIWVLTYKLKLTWSEFVTFNHDNGIY